MIGIKITKPKEIHKSIIITAICAIAFIEAIAISNGINGIVLSTVLVIIAGLAGLSIPTPFKIK